MAREHQVGIRLTTEEKVKWESIAKNSGLTLSAYVKRCVERQEIADKIADKRAAALQGISNVVKARKEFDSKYAKGGQLHGGISAEDVEMINANLNDVVYHIVEVLEREGLVQREKSSVKRNKK